MAAEAGRKAHVPPEQVKLYDHDRGRFYTESTASPFGLSVGITTSAIPSTTSCEIFAA
ncbi:hypothetical protein [Azospirillum endophyticum]